MADQELQKISRQKRNSRDNSNIRYERRFVRGSINNIKAGLRGINHDSDEVTEELNGVQELEEFASLKVNKPDFPYLLFMVALIFDILDVADFSGFGYFVMLIIKIVFTIYLFFWMFNKLSGIFTRGSKILFKTRFGKKILVKTSRRFLSRRLAYIFVFNIIPFIGILASNAFFVFLAHNHMNKLAQTYIRLIEDVSKKLSDYKKSV